MNKLSEKFLAVLVEEILLPPRDVYQTLKNLLYAFVAKDNPAKDSTSNRTFHSEFRQALVDDPDYQRQATIDQFLLVCEKLIYKWQEVQFQYDFRNDKRRALSPANLPRDSNLLRRLRAASRPKRDTP